MNTHDASSSAASCHSLLSFILLVAAALTACQKSETVPTTADRLKHVEQKQQGEPDFFVPRKAVDYMSDLKSIKESAPRPPPPVTASAAPQPTAKSAAASPLAEPKPAAPTLTAPVNALPQPAPATPAPAAAIVASAQPTARPVPAREITAVLTVISREQPEFPREAARAGIEAGSVRARLVINAAGGVAEVIILEARPTRVFDRAVTRALSHWKFNPGTEGRLFETEINFKL